MHLGSDSILDTQVYCFKDTEIISDVSLHFFTHKHFDYVNEINEFIKMASMSGLINRWYSISKSRIKSEVKESNDGIVDSHSIKGLYIIYFLINICILSTYIVERIVHKKARTPNPAQIWLLIDKLVAPDRLFWTESILYWK